MMKKFLGTVGVMALTVTACVSTVKNNERDVASIADIFRKNMEYYSTNFSDERPARLFSTKDIQKLASSAKLNLLDARLIIDNDAAFDSKLEMLKRAKKEIRMVYFIYSDDDSSSLITDELIKKAQQGVQVKLLVDFITNYSKLDLFQMMVNEGKGNLKIHFYNFPSAQIISDAKYMTLPCPPAGDHPTAKQCEEFKAPLMQALRQQETTSFSKMFLTGLYGKNGTALKIAMGYGAGIDPAKLKAMKAETDEAEQAIIFDFFKLLKRAASGDLIAKLQISIALASNGETLNPVLNELTGRMPFLSNAINKSSGISHVDEWDHLTDYTHHKLVAVDGQEFQLGGRNIEDSYHMKSRLGTKGKYIFMDTDFYGRTSGSGTREIETSYDKLFNFSEMVADITTVQRVVPIDLAVNTESLMMATGACLQQAQQGQVPMDKLGSCIESTVVMMPKYQTQTMRMTAAKKEMMDSMQRYLAEYAASKKVLRDNWKNLPYSSGVDHLSKSDLANAEVYYLENVTYNKSSSADLKRRAGSRVGAEAAFNKNIHAAWYRGLENVCKVSRDEKRDMRVIMHSAYLFMPSGLMHRLAKMMNGDYGNCSRVRISFLTNSFETTDLNVINVFARYQMSELFKHYEGLLAYEKQFNKENAGYNKYTRFFPQLDYYDYKASSVGTGISLHTKLSVLGDDIIIGSANADVRSYYMDTNNGVLIRNAKEFNRDYIHFVDSLMNDRTRTSALAPMYAAVTADQLKAQNKQILAMLLNKFDKKGKVDSARQQRILQYMDKIGEKINYTTKRMLNFRGYLEDFKFQNDGSQLSDLERELNETANSFDDFFKVL